MSSVVKTMKLLINSLVAIAFAGALALPVEAAAALTNGDFETGLTGWSTADALGSDGSFVVQSGTASPVNGDPVPAPPGGLNAAMSDAGAPGAHVLWQDFTVSVPVSQFLLSFDLFIGNRAGMFATPNPADLDFGINAANQQVRVDILKSSAAPFSVAPGDVLAFLYQTNPGDPLVSGYATHSFDITALVNANLGSPLRLRFAETDNLAQLQAGVDNVSLEAFTVTPTATPTGTPTATPTSTPLTDGAACTAPAECASTFCVDGVCCSTACNGPAEVCNLPGRRGTCTQGLPVPASSRSSVVATAMVLLAVGALALARRRARR